MNLNYDKAPDSIFEKDKSIADIVQEAVDNTQFVCKTAILDIIHNKINEIDKARDILYDLGIANKTLTSLICILEQIKDEIELKLNQ